MRDASCSLSLDFIMKFLDLDCSTEGLKCLQSCIWFHGVFLPFRVWNTKSHGYWIYILWNRKLEFKCDFKKGLIPLREAAEQLTKIVIGDLCFAIGPSFFCEENEKKRIHWKLILAHIHPNQIKLDVLSSSSPNLESFLFTSDKTFQ